MEILVFGAGSLGSLVGGLLAQVHDVTLVGRDPHVTAVREEGLSITGAVDVHTDPDATTTGTELRADLAVVTVKAYDTGVAAEALATGTYGAVCSLQNGLTEEILVARLSAGERGGDDEDDSGDVESHTPKILSGTATYGARLREPGHVECTGVGTIAIGAYGGGSDPWADRAGEAFDAAGIETQVATDMPRRRWEKLAINAGINAPTALARVKNGELVDGPASDLSREAARETARVAHAEGVSLSESAAAAAVEGVADATAANHSSMRQDIKRGNRTEIDAINGVVCDRASTHGIDVPVNRTLTGLVRAWETERDLR
ncbi:2-dehydropantoate 2-reductase [Halalkaliarchaeum desulfuricum]|uniref:2-dehydropantoate 2-reductase n=1 Tax=Halalkaliarchaeum desulfuricum TaxID=2055893 RepID=A0A343TP49_9EURY|nr:ketopantoate reductase family protein [Halalkaliarchaeum desulfuricum]AUX10871.1 2-dehydropantoate 2-reductase [Halalkaliarchaeum desulfuricum]